jgi:hypothetical protein
MKYKQAELFDSRYYIREIRKTVQESIKKNKSIIQQVKVPSIKQIIK